MNKKNQIIIIALVVVAIIVGAVVFKKSGKTIETSKWPERSINNYVPWAAGGGTDVWNRVLSAEMEGTLGQKVIVSNVVGGTGAVGTDLVMKAAHDGYRILGTSETNLTIPIMTGTKTTVKDWHYFIAAGSPGVICVNSASPYKTIEELLAATKKEPGKIKVSITGSGLWFIQAEILKTKGGMDLGYAPYDGSRPAILAAVSKETTAVVASAGEVNEFVKAGTLRPLAVMQTEAFEFPSAGKLPAITDTLPGLKEVLPLDQFIGFSLPSDTPQAIVDKYTDAFNKAMKSDTVKRMANEQLSVLYGLSGKEADDMAAKMQSKMSYLLKDMGLAKFDPKDMGIPQP